QTGSWRIVFAFYGALGLVWAAFFWWLFRDSPREHPWSNSAEASLVEGQAPAPSTPRRAFDLPVLAMLQSKEVWLLCGFNLLVNIGWGVLGPSLPPYFIVTHVQTR